MRVGAWIAVAGVAMIGLSQLVPRGAWLPPVYIGQALSPYLFGAMVPLALVALAQRDLPLGLAAAAASIPLLVLSAPLVAAPSLPPAAPDATPLRVLSANVLYDNDDVEGAAKMLAGADVDVLVVSELTDEIDDAMVAAGVLDRFPFRAGTPDTWNRGLALWSRFPITASQMLPVLGRTTVEALIDVDGTTIRVIGAHPPQPISREGRRAWGPALDQIGDVALADPSMPTLLVGDMNASYWHPPFRHLLDRGFVDAHIALGHPFSHSWPADLPLLPAFVRIDHALLGPGITATSIEDVGVPGSDHIAFVVTVAPTEN